MTGAAVNHQPLLDADGAAADADCRSRELYLHQVLAQGAFTPARLKMISAELRDIVALAGKRGDG